jgi:hypothetical protein
LHLAQATQFAASLFAAAPFSKAHVWPFRRTAEKDYKISELITIIIANLLPET